MTFEVAKGMVACLFALALFVSVGGALAFAAFVLVSDARVAQRLSGDSQTRRV